MLAILRFPGANARGLIAPTLTGPCRHLLHAVHWVDQVPAEDLERRPGAPWQGFDPQPVTVPGLSAITGPDLLGNVRPAVFWHELVDREPNKLPFCRCQARAWPRRHWASPPGRSASTGAAKWAASSAPSSPSCTWTSSAPASPSCPWEPCAALWCAPLAICPVAITYTRRCQCH